MMHMGAGGNGCVRCNGCVRGIGCESDNWCVRGIGCAKGIWFMSAIGCVRGIVRATRIQCVRGNRVCRTFWLLGPMGIAKAMGVSSPSEV